MYWIPMLKSNTENKITEIKYGWFAVAVNDLLKCFILKGIGLIHQNIIKTSDNDEFMFIKSQVHIVKYL